ncbi:hypothetical protein GCM10027061_19750 [Nesterenkonia suensis]
MSSRLLSHVLFGVSTLLALIVTVSVVGDLLGWWQSLLNTPMLVSAVAVSLVLTLCARHLRDDKRCAAT